MKTIMLIATILFFGSTIYGQMLDEGEFEQMQAKRSLEKRAVMDLFIELEGAPAVEFWSLYEEYEQMRLQLRRDRMASLHRYIQKYMEMTDEETDLVMEKTISTRKAYHELIDSYYEKTHSSSGARAAAQFYQVEYYFLNLTRVSIMNEMPFFGEENLQ